MNQFKLGSSIVTLAAILLTVSIIVTSIQCVKAQSESTNTNNEIKSIVSTSNPVLNITSVSNYFTENYFYIVGEVLNKAQSEKTYVRVTATLYDDTNKVIGTSYTFTDPTTIPPSESAPFKLPIGLSDVSNLESIKSYKLMVSSN